MGLSLGNRAPAEQTAAYQQWRTASAEQTLEDAFEKPVFPQIKGNRYHVRRLLALYEKWAWAWIKMAAVDLLEGHDIDGKPLQVIEPAKCKVKSNYTDLPESVKAQLRIERRQGVIDTRAEYLAEANKTKKNSTAADIQSAAKVASETFADVWPEPFKYIATRFPQRPYVSNDLDFGTKVRGIKSAANYRYIQYNTVVSDHLLIVDYDCPDTATGAPGLDVADVCAAHGAPIPTWICRRPGSKKGHIAWALAKPVITSPAGKHKPLQYLQRIEAGMTSLLNGDARFSGLLTKNPVNTEWDVWWGNPTPYSLDDLAQNLDIKRYPVKSRTMEKVEAMGLGSKVLCFEETRNWAYFEVPSYWGLGKTSWDQAVLAHLVNLNSSFSEPLLLSHIKAITKSVANWVWSRFTPLTRRNLVLKTHKPAEQALRGAQKGAKRRQALLPSVLEMRMAGASTREIGDALNIDHTVIFRWVNTYLENPM